MKFGSGVGICQTQKTVLHNPMVSVFRRNHEWSVTCCPGGTCWLALQGRDGFIVFSIFSRRCH